MLENVLLLLMFIFITWMWIMVNQARQEIRNKRNMDREQEAIESVAMDERSRETAFNGLETLEFPTEIG